MKSSAHMDFMRIKQEEFDSEIIQSLLERIDNQRIDRPGPWQAALRNRLVKRLQESGLEGTSNILGQMPLLLLISSRIRRKILE